MIHPIQSLFPELYIESEVAKSILSVTMMTLLLLDVNHTMEIRISTKGQRLCVDILHVGLE